MFSILVNTVTVKLQPPLTRHVWNHSQLRIDSAHNWVISSTTSSFLLAAELDVLFASVDSTEFSGKAFLFDGDSRWFFHFEGEPSLTSSAATLGELPGAAIGFFFGYLLVGAPSGVVTGDCLGKPSDAGTVSFPGDPSADFEGKGGCEPPCCSLVPCDDDDDDNDDDNDCATGLQ